MSTTITINEAQAIYTVPFSEDVLTEGPVIVERKGRQIAVIVNANEFQAFRVWRDGRLWQQKELGRLHIERAAFQRLLLELLKTYCSQFVAVYNGRVVDDDADESAPARRAIAWGYRPCYIQEVRTESRIYELPSPEGVDLSKQHPTVWTSCANG